jgi:hypothetical protein
MLLLGLITVSQVFFVIKRASQSGSLESKEFQDRYGTLIHELDLSRPFAVYYHPFILTRWLLTVLTLIILRDFYSLQLILFYMFSLFTQYLLIHLKPMKEMNENYFGVFNEFMVQLYIYLMIALTQFNGSNKARSELGLGLVAIIILSLAVNIGKFIISLCSALIKKCK